jgi:ATP-binding cassette subfamily C exporter for protease/lipase
MKIKLQEGPLKDIIHRFRREYSSIFAFSAVINILMLIPSWYMLEVYDRVLTSRDDNTLLGLSLIALFLYAIYALLERYRGLMLITVSEGLDHQILPKIHAKLLSPQHRNQSNLGGLINDLNLVKQFLTGQPILSFLDTPWVVIYLVTIFMIHPAMGLLALLSAIFLFLLAILNQRVTEPLLSESQKNSLEERRLINNLLSASESVVVLGMRKKIYETLSVMRQKYLTSLVGASLKGVDFSALTKFFRILIQSAILGYGAYLAIDNQISAGMIIAGSILLGRTLAPIEGVINSWKQLSEFKKSYAQLNESLSSLTDESHTVNLGRPNGAYQIKNVSLSLRPVGKPTLENITLEIAAGETVAIIGPSGAGKTSLLKIIAGVIDPNEGQVLIDGSDLKHRNKDELGSYIGYLSQSTDLMAGKISENIARFSEIDSDQVIAAAKIAGAHEMILSLPNGYETELGDMGAGVSEGQRRKIALARAFYGKPQVLLLDEPGNSLDDASINQLGLAIQQNKQNKVTCIFTTHQPNLAQLADKILLIIDGQLRLYGNAKDVISQLTTKQTKA